MVVQEIARGQTKDAEAVIRVKGSPSGPKFELNITADPANTEPVDGPQAHHRHKDVVQLQHTMKCAGREY